MSPQDRASFAPIITDLKDGRSLTVRFLEPADGEALAEFYESVPRADYRFYSPHPLTRCEALKKAEGRADAATLVCAVGVEDGGRIVGYAWYDWPDAESQTSTFGICIRRGHQDSGAAQAIMRRLLEAAHTVGPAWMSLTVQKANSRAVALYQKMGFSIVREQTRLPFEEFPAEAEFYMERAAR